ncbi:MAG: hypothetical protein JJT88_05605 [Gammaproteobacteria bacterium]|nr:hypothetical protein [Gammaproteobacteria bacterium]
MRTLAERVQTYATEVTGLPVTWGARLSVRLPQYLSSRYEVHAIRVDGLEQHAILLPDKDLPSPTVLDKHVRQLAELIGAVQGGYCLVAENLPPYLRRRLVQLKIPFVIPGRQMYWPALGMWQTHQRAGRLRPEPVESLGPAAQQLFIAAVLGKLPSTATLTSTAERLGYSAMSVSRALKELEGCGLLVSRQVGRRRSLELGGQPKALWEDALPRLQNPVANTIRVLKRDLPSEVGTVAGESALARYSLLSEPPEPTLAMASREWNRRYRKIPTIPAMDDDSCQVELWCYPPEPTAEHGRVDRLSLFLSQRKNPDERVQLALDEMMEQLAW